MPSIMLLYLPFLPAVWYLFYVCWAVSRDRDACTNFWHMGTALGPPSLAWSKSISNEIQDGGLRSYRKWSCRDNSATAYPISLKSDTERVSGAALVTKTGPGSRNKLPANRRNVCLLEIRRLPFTDAELPTAQQRTLEMHPQMIHTQMTRE